jgi:hypothetical protein
MTILYSSNKGQLITIDHDPDAKNLYTLIYRPETWVASREVIQDSIILIPTIPNGCMYLCVQGGITGTVEPIWKTQRNAINTSGSAIFKTLVYSLKLKTGDTIQANVGEGWPSHELILPIGLTVDNIALINQSIVQFRVLTVPGIGLHSITSRISILKANGIYIRYDDTVNLNVVQQ